MAFFRALCVLPTATRLSSFFSFLLLLRLFTSFCVDRTFRSFIFRSRCKSDLLSFLPCSWLPRDVSRQLRFHEIVSVCVGPSFGCPIEPFVSVGSDISRIVQDVERVANDVASVASGVIADLPPFCAFNQIINQV